MAGCRASRSAAASGHWGLGRQVKRLFVGRGRYAREGLRLCDGYRARMCSTGAGNLQRRRAGLQKREW